MKSYQTQPNHCLNRSHANQCPQRSLSNAQFFIRELVQHHAFPLHEIAHNSRITQSTLKNLYDLKIRSLSTNRFKHLLEFYCAVTYAGLKPHWHDQINSLTQAK